MRRLVLGAFAIYGAAALLAVVVDQQGYHAWEGDRERFVWTFEGLTVYEGQKPDRSFSWREVISRIPRFDALYHASIVYRVLMVAGAACYLLPFVFHAKRPHLFCIAGALLALSGACWFSISLTGMQLRNRSGQLTWSSLAVIVVWSTLACAIAILWFRARRAERAPAAKVAAFD